MKKSLEMKDVDSRLSEALLAKQTEALSSELSNMKNLKSKKGFSSAIFQLKDNILGSKKMAQEAASLIDYKTGCLLTNPSDSEYLFSIARNFLQLEILRMGL